LTVPASLWRSLIHREAPSVVPLARAPCRRQGGATNARHRSDVGTALLRPRHARRARFENP
jgi:hypothetical protein